MCSDVRSVKHMSGWSIVRHGTVVAHILLVLGLAPLPVASQEKGEHVWVASAIHAEVVVIDPTAEAVVKTLTPVDGNLCEAGSAGFVELTVAGGAVWAADTGGRLCRIDPTEMQATGVFLPAQGIRNAYAAAGGEGSVWVVGDPFFWRVDARNLTLTDAVPVEYQEDTALDVVVAGSSVWGLRRAWPWALYRVPIGGGSSVPDSVAVPDAYPQVLGSGFGSLWSYGSADPSGMVVLRHDPESGRILTRIPVANSVDWHEEPAMAVGEEAVWLGMGDLGEVAKVDPAGQVHAGTVAVGGYVWSLAAGAGSVWVGVESDEGTHQIVRADPRTLEILARIPIEGRPPRAIVVR